MVVASISLNGGHYSKRCLIIFGELPEILINTASGKPLYEIVDHSAFEMAKLKVVRATGRQAACDFEHQRKFGFVGLASS